MRCDALENEVAVLVLKILVEYQSRGHRGGPNQNRLNRHGSDRGAFTLQELT
jgi:hypothetical protein